MWIHGAVSRVQFGDHYLQVLSGDNVPQSISWAPTSHDADHQKRKLQFYPSPYGYQALLDISHSELRQFGGHRINPYALLARSLSTIIRATFPVNDRINHLVRMILHLRTLYNRIPRRHWVSHNPWATPPSLEPGPPPQNFSAITFNDLESHPCWKRGPLLTPLAPTERGSALSRGGPRPVLPQRRRARSNSNPQASQMTSTSTFTKQPAMNHHSRLLRPAGVFGVAISAATEDAMSRAQQGVSASSRRFSQSVIGIPHVVSSSKSAAASSAQSQCREGTPSSTDRTTEYDSSKDPLDVISIPDISKLAISDGASMKASHSTERGRTLSQHPATSHRVGGSSSNTLTARPKSRDGSLTKTKNFAAPLPRFRNPSTTLPQ